MGLLQVEMEKVEAEQNRIKGNIIGQLRAWLGANRFSDQELVEVCIAFEDQKVESELAVYRTLARRWLALKYRTKHDISDEEFVTML